MPCEADYFCSFLLRTLIQSRVTRILITLDKEMLWIYPNALVGVGRIQISPTLRIRIFAWRRCGSISFTPSLAASSGDLRRTGLFFVKAVYGPEVGPSLPVSVSNREVILF